MKKVLLFTFALLGATACTPIYDYREKVDLYKTYTTSKSVESVSECILVEWQKEPLGFPVGYQKTGIYHTVYGQAFCDAADTFAENQITRVNYYSCRGPLDPWNGKVKRSKAIERCL